MNAPLTREQLTGKAPMPSYTKNHGQQKALSDGQNSIREMFTYSTASTPGGRDQQIWDAAVEAEEILTTKKLGVQQQAFLVGRLQAALGHLG